MLEVNLLPGKYVVAVSGGVDSMVLLDILRQQPSLELIVAHFDHGIRDDSGEDRQLVEEAARAYGLAFTYAEGNLGARASEAAARSARFAFLEDVRRSYNGDAIVTAHHQDDRIETAILNLKRGTNRRGLSSLKSTTTLLRPLLPYPKVSIHAYARDHAVRWREDSTNQSDAYARNYVRRHVMPRLDAEKRRDLLKILDEIAATNSELDELLEQLVKNLIYEDGLDRYKFIMLAHSGSKEVLAQWLRAAGIADYDARALERLTVGVKTALSGSQLDINRGAVLRVYKHKLALDLVKR